MKKADKEELLAVILVPIFLGTLFIPTVIMTKQERDEAQRLTIEKYNKVYSVLDDEQKRRADSLSPVCSESEYRHYSCEERVKFLEKLYLSGGDIPQSGLPFAGE